MVASKAEGFGRVTVEYMLSGLLVIASNSGANNELIENFRTGILYKYGDQIDLCQKLCWVINHREDVETIKKHAYKTARAKFSEEEYIARIYDVYKELLYEN